MAYRISGNWLGSCSCKMICPCALGPATPDQGWCSAAIVIDVTEGQSEGVDLSGARAVVALDLPGDFVGGNATARIYLDAAAADEQRRELENVLSGKRGGVWEVLASGVVTQWLPSKTAAITVSQDHQAIEVDGAGQIRLDPIKNESGTRTRLVNAPVQQLWNYEGGGVDLARADGTSWSDPEMRAWKSLGFGEMAQFEWTA